MPEIARILVFDSGLGGLSIVHELSAASLNVEICYLADTGYFPYGEKSDASLIARIPNLVRKGVDVSQADLAIIACNTASTLALEAIRGSVSVPVVGVVPAIKPAAQHSKTGVIGLLATPNTVARPYTDRLIGEFAPNVKVIRHGAIGLAAAVEAMLCGEPLSMPVLETAMRGLLEQKSAQDIDTIILACTHYPHVVRELAQYAPNGIQFIDSGAAIARRVADVLGLDTDHGPALGRAYFSGDAGSQSIKGLKLWGFSNTHLLDF